MRAPSTSADKSTLNPKGFALKGGLFPLTLLEILHTDTDELRRELMIKSKQAPAFFNQAPAILSVEHLDSEEGVDLAVLRDLCQEAGLCIVALREASTALNQKARDINLAVLPKSRARTAGHNPTEIEFPEPGAEAAPAKPSSAKAGSGRKRKKSRAAARAEAVAIAEAAAQAEADAKQVKVEAEAAEKLVAVQVAADDIAVLSDNVTKLVTTPIRSGQQVYAPGGDLIVAAPVSAGAELLADGNIHVYGALRGRALAGVKGNENARIFCQQMEAELVSIAGNFKMEEELSDNYRGKPVQVFLQDNALKVETLVAKDR